MKFYEFKFSNFLFKVFNLVFSILHNLILILLFGLTQLFSIIGFAIGFLHHKIVCRFTNQRVRVFKLKLKESQKYEEWKSFAQQLDIEHDTIGWKFEPYSRFYDSHNLRLIIDHLNELLEKNKIQKCAHLIRALMTRNFSGVTNQDLYNFNLSGTKVLVEEYYKCILKCLKRILHSDMPFKLEYFKDLNHIYGKTGLMFSGGASIGMFHLGVISALLEADLLPSVFCGSSVGSMICSLVGTISDDELKTLAKDNFRGLDFSSFKNVSSKGQVIRKFKRLLTLGYFIDKKPLQEFLITNTFNLTFEEAFKKTGRVINITVTDSSHQKFHVLNYLSAPNVYIWSAALASCSLPFVYAPTQILAKFGTNKSHVWMPSEKMFIDGSIGADIPDRVLAEKFNVTNFIVSQVNFYVVPFLMNSRFYRFSNKLPFLRLWEIISTLFLSELKHRFNQLTTLGLVPKRFALLINILMQDYTGNVTIFPNLNYADFAKLLDNPCPDSIEKWTQRGRNSTFFSDFISFGTHQRLNCG